MSSQINNLKQFRFLSLNYTSDNIKTNYHDDDILLDRVSM